MIRNWGTVEADWEAVYHRDLGADVFRKRKTWRWVETRLYGLLQRDTPTAKLFAQAHAHGATHANRPSLTPEQVGDWFASHVKR